MAVEEDDFLQYVYVQGDLLSVSQGFVPSGGRSVFHLFVITIILLCLLIMSKLLYDAPFCL